MKKLGYKSKAKNNSNIVLNIENEVCHDPCIIANHLNDFFTTVASSLVNK